MSVMAKMLTLLRSSVREIGESVVNASASQLIEQELLDARSRLQEARRELAALMAQQPALTRQADSLRAEMAQRESQALQALQRQDSAQAERLSEQLAQLETELERHQHLQQDQQAQADKLKALLREAEAQLREQERELAMARAAESLQRATQSVAASGLQPSKAREALERLQERNRQLQDRLDAERRLAEELDPQPAPPESPDEKAERSQQVLARLRARAAGSP